MLYNKIKQTLKAARQLGSTTTAGLLLSQVLVTDAWGQDETAEAKFNFNIAAQGAGESLIQFAQQADLTVVFPFDKVKNSQANALNGEYTTRQAIGILLENTGLEASFDTAGILKIVQNNSAIDEDGGILAQISRIFEEDPPTMVTYPSDDDSQYELILVKGLRASMRRSMDIKHNQVGVVDAIQAEEIGKFPDLNLAESLQRISGVSIDRSEGEGQFVTVRGFGPEFNTVMTNGRRLATDNLGREFSFDTLASELVSGVSVYKTFSAVNQSGGIGSVIDIQTARPLDIPGFKVAGSVKALYDTNSEKTTPQGALLLSQNLFDGRFGWLVSLSHQKRSARINEVQTDGWLLNTNIPEQELTTTANNIFVPRNYDQRVRFDERTRNGGTLVLQYRPTRELQFSADLLTSRFDVETDATSMGHWFTSSNLEQVRTDSNGTVIEFVQNVGHATDFHARTFDRPSKLNAYGINIDWQPQDDLVAEFDLSLSDATIEDTSGAANALALIGYLNRSRFDHSQGHVLPTISGFAAADTSIIDAEGQPAGVSDYLDPANGRAHVMLRRGWNIRDDLDQARLDLTWDSDLGSLYSLSLGTLYTHQTKRNERWDNEKDAVHCTFCGYFNTPDLPDSFQQVFDAGSGFMSALSGSESLPHQWLRHDGEQLFSYLETLSGISFAAVPRDNSFTVDEEIFSAYIQTEFNFDIQDNLLTLEAGVRYEDTQVSVSAVESPLLALTILDQTELGQVTGPPVPQQASASYHNWLPSITARLDFADDMLARAAYSHSLTRPTMEQMSPGLVLNTTRQGGDLRASSGNPSLRPFESINLDLAWEWYFAPSSYVSVSYFRKQVDNFIVSSVSDLVFEGVTDPSTGSDPNGPDPSDTLARFDLTQPSNGETATVDGWEFAIQYNFADSGFGILANMTVVDSNAELDPNNISQKFALTGLSDSQNLILFYDKGPAQARLAWNNRDGFLQSLVQIQGGEPTFVDDYHQLDMSASYALNNHLSIFVEGINLTEEYVLKHGRYANQLLLAQDSGARYSLGIRGSF